MCQIYQNGIYNATCATELLNIYPYQYNYLMALNGSLMGFLFASLVLLIVVRMRG